MALVSGRPISFQMDLYTPLYVPRPTVVPELFASLRPVTYNGDLQEREEALAGRPLDAGGGIGRQRPLRPRWPRNRTRLLPAATAKARPRRAALRTTATSWAT